MIRYDLTCEGGHAFDAWFRDSAAFDDQQVRGALSCPACGSTRVSKALMSPAVAKIQSPGSDERAKAFAGFLRAVRQHVVANAEDVGHRFPEEARRIHYEEVEPKGIYGQASPEEAKALVEEGIPVCPLPIVPEETN